MIHSKSDLLETGGVTNSKDKFLQQARDARINREMNQRQETSAIKLQAFFKSIHCRRQLKQQLIQELKSLINKGGSQCLLNGQALLYLIRKTIFYCDKVKEKDIMDDLINLISSNIRAASRVDSSSKKTLWQDDKNLNIVDSVVVDESIKPNIDTFTYLDSNNCNRAEKEFTKVIIKQLLDHDQIQSKQMSILIVYLIDLCLDKIVEIDVKTSINNPPEKVNKILIDCLTIVNALINLDTKAREFILEKDPSDRLKKLTDEFISKTITKRADIYDCLSKIILNSVKHNTVSTNENNKSLVLLKFVELFIKLMDLNNESCKLTTDYVRRMSYSKGLVDNLKRFLSTPGLIVILEDNSKESLDLVNQSGIFLTALSTLSCYFDLIQDDTTSIQALCLLGNMIHLSSLNEEILKKYLIEFCSLMTKLLQLCKKNSAHNSHISGNLNDLGTFIDANSNDNDNSRNNTKTKNIKLKTRPKDVSHNPILGWLERDKDIRLDKNQLINQLSRLWSAKYLKILFMDLIKTNEGGFSNNNAQSKTKAMKVNKQDDVQEEEKPESAQATNPITTMNLLRRVTTRWKASSQPNELISINYSNSTSRTIPGILNYGRPWFLGASDASKCKLLTTEANKIGAICQLLNSAIQSLIMIKQDILTNICMHHYILLNLWTFIKSLGPNNGLTAYLELLNLMRKQQSIKQIPIPEFYILGFFCECASNLINVLDESELYDLQKPFKQEDLLAISSFMNHFVYHVLTFNGTGVNSNANYLDSSKNEMMQQLVQQPHRLLKDLYTRDCRRRFAPKEHWFIKELKVSSFLRDIESKKITAFKVLQMIPHIIPHKERIQIFRKFISMDKLVARPSTLISIHRSRIVEDGYQQLACLAPEALKGLIRVKFINDFGLGEAGIDQDGVFKEFLEETMKLVFDPALNLFKTTSEQCLYPSPTSCLHENYESLFNFVGKMLAKAVYEGIMVDLPFAPFFLRRVVGQPQNALYSPLDELPSLDPELFKSLTYIKHYEGDVSELALTFCIDQDFMGRIETHELEPGGRTTPVTRENRVRYIHLVADFHLRKQIARQTHAFIRGFQSIIEPGWLSMFSASDLQNLISGDNTPIDLHDLRKNTKYSGGFHNNHRVISWLWDILDKDFTPDELKLFLKFTTSCSKPPLLGFSHLEPPFSIRCIEVSDDLDLGDTLGSIVRGFLAIRRSDPVDRLPTSSTCFNLLKLPNYQRRSTLKDKLRYAIHSNAGFELS